MTSGPLLITLGLDLLPVIEGKRTRNGEGHLSLVHTTTKQTSGRASSPTLMPLGQPARMQTPSHTLPPQAPPPLSRASSPTLITLVPTFLPAVGGKKYEEGAHFSFSHVTAWQTNFGASFPMFTPLELACYASAIMTCSIPFCLITGVCARYSGQYNAGVLDYIPSSLLYGGVGLNTLLRQGRMQPGSQTPRYPDATGNYEESERWPMGGGGGDRA